MSSNEKSVSIDKSNEDISLTKKAKDAFSLIGNYLLCPHCVLFLIFFFKCFIFFCIELLVTRTQSDTDSQILFFDQFALMLFHGLLLDKTFVVICFIYEYSLPTVILTIFLSKVVNSIFLIFLVCCFFSYEKKLSVQFFNSS